MATQYRPLSDLGQTLVSLRNEAGKKQSDLAKQLKVDASRLSRLESGEYMPGLEEIEGYLAAVGTEKALEYLDFLQEEWRALPRPPFAHPDRSALRQAEEVLQRLEDFCAQPNKPYTLIGQAEMYAQNVRDAANYLAGTGHSVAFIGDVGVGKTTFICAHTGLTVEAGARAGTQHRIALETGRGGTTISEVRIRRGPSFGIQVEPLEDSEVYRYVGEFCAGLKQNMRGGDEDGEQAMGVSREIDRALRNMSGLSRKYVKDGEGKRTTINPAAELAARYESLAELRADVSERLRLWQRMEREVWTTGSGADGIKWLSETFRAINNGLHPGFTIPKRIHVVVPFAPLPGSEYELDIFDTKGVDGTVVRADLENFARDQRTVTVLCSKFSSAPDTSLQSYIEHLNRVVLGTAVHERMLLLVLPHTEEALSMKDDVGDIVESAEEAYEFKRDQASARLRNVGAAQMPILFSDINADDLDLVSQAIFSMIREMRAGRARVIESIAAATEELYDNEETEHARTALIDIAPAMSIYCDQHRRVHDYPQPIHKVVIKTIRDDIHPRTLWASVRRQGEWTNLDVYHHLGSAAVDLVRKRSSQSFIELTAIINHKLGVEALAPMHRFLGTLNQNVESWRQAYYEAVRHHGQLIFRPALEDAKTLWAACEALYGQGKLYRHEVAKLLDEWFDDPQQEHLHVAFENRVQKAWQEQVLDPLMRVCNEPIGAAEEEEAGVAV